MSAKLSSVVAAAAASGTSTVTHTPVTSKAAAVAEESVSSRESRVRVLVVGTNLCGLACAVTCLRAGCMVDLCERNERIPIPSTEMTSAQRQLQDALNEGDEKKSGVSGSDAAALAYARDVLHCHNADDMYELHRSLLRVLADAVSVGPHSHYSTEFDRHDHHLRLMLGMEAKQLLRGEDGRVVGVQVDVHQRGVVISSRVCFADVVVIAARHSVDRLLQQPAAPASVTADFPSPPIPTTTTGVFARPLANFATSLASLAAGLALATLAVRHGDARQHLHVMNTAMGVAVPQRPAYYDARGVWHPVGIQPDRWTPLTVQSRLQLSPSVHLFRFQLQTPSSQLGLFSGQHIALRLPRLDDPKLAPLIRYYTPVSRNSTLGHFDLLIKIEPKLEKLPHTSMQKVLAAVRVGQAVDVKGPMGGFVYHRNTWRAVGMICGGTGITPMLQVLRSVASHAEDHTAVSVVYASTTESELLCRDELMYLSATRTNVHCHLVLEQPPANWSEGVGRVSAALLKQHLPPPRPRTVILMCGPPLMMRACRNVLLNELGYTEDMLYDYDQPHKPVKINTNPTTATATFTVKAKL